MKGIPIRDMLLHNRCKNCKESHLYCRITNLQNSDKKTGYRYSFSFGCLQKRASLDYLTIPPPTHLYVSSSITLRQIDGSWKNNSVSGLPTL